MAYPLRYRKMLVWWYYTSMQVTLIVVILIAKFTLPLLLPFFPFAASWANFILDSIDGDLLVPLGLPNATYQLWDKSADYLTYIMMLFAARNWPIRKTVFALFAFRTVGQALFFITHDDTFFFYFPNFLEPLFMIYAFLLWKYKDKAFAVYKKHILPIWIIIISYKMWNEYNIHIARTDLSDKYL